jgi:hypothetical protein
MTSEQFDIFMTWANNTSDMLFLLIIIYFIAKALG